MEDTRMDERGVTPVRERTPVTPTPPNGIPAGRPDLGDGPGGRRLRRPVAAGRTGWSDDHVRSADDPAAADPGAAAGNLDPAPRRPVQHPVPGPRGGNHRCDRDRARGSDRSEPHGVHRAQRGGPHPAAACPLSTIGLQCGPLNLSAQVDLIIPSTVVVRAATLNLRARTITLQNPSFTINGAGLGINSLSLIIPLPPIVNIPLPTTAIGF